MQNPVSNAGDTKHRLPFRFGVLFKGVLIVCIPLIFQILFVIVLTSQIKQLELEVARESRARKILQTIGKLTEMTYEIGAGGAALRGVMGNSSSKEVEAYVQTLELAQEQGLEYRKQLRGWVADYPDEKKAFERLDKVYENSAEMIDGLIKSVRVQGDVSGLAEKLEFYKDFRRTDLKELINSLRAFMARYKKIEKGSPEAQKRLRDAQKSVIICGMVGNVVIALLLVLYFSRSITNRLKIMTVNTSLLANRQPLLEPIKGSDEIAQLDSVFHQMADALDGAAQEKKQFLELVTHDIRSPLTAILGNLVLLNLGKMGDLSDSAKQRMSVTETNTRRLITLINDFLDYEKLESGKVELRRSELRVEDLIDEVFQQMEAQAEAFDAELEMDVEDDELTVYVDRERTVQVLCNLIGNSFFSASTVPSSLDGSSNSQSTELSPAKRRRRIIVKAIEKSHQVEISVIDRNRSVPSRICELVFNQQDHSKSVEVRQHFGKGLSLALSKMIIEHQGGQIGVRSDDKGGVCFWFLLDKQSAQASDKIST